MLRRKDTRDVSFYPSSTRVQEIETRAQPAGQHHPARRPRHRASVGLAGRPLGAGGPPESIELACILIHAWLVAFAADHVAESRGSRRSRSAGRAGRAISPAASGCDRRQAGRAPPRGTSVSLVIDSRDQAVPATRDGFDELRSVGVIAERFAQPLDDGVDAVLEVDERVVRP